MDRDGPRFGRGRRRGDHRAHVRTVVTEYGVAEPWGKSLRERADAIVAIAHPDHRDRLAFEAKRSALIQA